MQKIIGYNLRQLGKSYDIPRAILLLSSVTLRLQGEPDQFFCSQLVMHTLKHAELYIDDINQLVDINHMTPVNVYDWLSNRKPRSIKKSDSEPKDE